MSTHFVAHRRLSLIVAVAVLSAGCATTQLTVENVTKGASVVGQIYYLPRVEFGIEVERELVACGEVSEPLEVETRVKVTPYVLPDLSAVYRIDYQGMRRKFKATEYALETYPNGTLKSLNTKLDDQTGDAIRGYLNGALRLAAAVPSSVISSAVANMRVVEKDRILRNVLGDARSMRFSDLSEAKKNSIIQADILKMALCNPQTLAQLNERAELENAMAPQERLFHKAEQGVLDVEAQLAVAQQALANARTDNRSGAYLAKRKQDVEDLRVARDAALSARNTAKSALGATGERLAKVRKALTVTGAHHFRPSHSDNNAPVQESIEARVGDANSAWIAPQHRQTFACDANNNTSVGCASLRLSVAIYRSPGVTPNGGRDEPKQCGGTAHNQSSEEDKGDKDGKGECGLVYRQPLEGLLMICAEKDCLAADGAIQAESRQTVLMSKVSVPQLGFLAVLPFVNKPFQNNSLQAAFAEDGALTKVSYVSNARAAKQANVFAESADSLLKFAEAKRAQPQESLNAELAKAQARTQLAEATLALERANRELEAFRSGESDGAAGTAEGE